MLLPAEIKALPTISLHVLSPKSEAARNALRNNTVVSPEIAEQPENPLLLMRR